MPYKDPKAKKEWERQHRPQRLARRRELRCVESAQKVAQPEAVADEGTHFGFVPPLVAGGALAACNPKLAMGAGGLTLIAAAVLKKGASWWLTGVVIFALGFLLYWNDRNAKNSLQFAKVRNRQILRVGRMERPVSGFPLTHQLAFDTAFKPLKSVVTGESI